MKNDSKERKGISEKYAFFLAVLILIAGTLVLEWQSAKKTALIAIVLLLAIYGICYYGFLHTKKVWARYACLLLVFAGLSGDAFL